jgi:hypothetical protein
MARRFSRHRDPERRDPLGGVTASLVCRFAGVAAEGPPDPRAIRPCLASANSKLDLTLGEWRIVPGLIVSFDLHLQNDGHRLVHWGHGGDTDMDNLVHR